MCTERRSSWRSDEQIKLKVVPCSWYQKAVKFATCWLNHMAHCLCVLKEGGRFLQVSERARQGVQPGPAVRWCGTAQLHSATSRLTLLLHIHTLSLSLSSLISSPELYPQSLACLNVNVLCVVVRCGDVSVEARVHSFQHCLSTRVTVGLI